MARRKVSIVVSENFFRFLDGERTKLREKTGLPRITMPDLTEILMKRGLYGKKKRRYY